MRRHTVVIVNDQAHIVGGAAKVALNSAVELANRGHRVVLLSAVGPIDDSLKDVPNLEVECLFQHEILRDKNRLRAATAGIWNHSAATRLEQVLQRYRSETPIVHFHPWVKSLSPSVFAAAKRCKVPFLITLHDYFTACPNGGFLDYQKGEVCTRNPLGLSCIACNCDQRSYYHKLWRVARGYIQKYVAGCPRDCKNYVAVSPFSERILRPFLPKDAHVDLVRCPIHVEQLPPIDASKNQEFLFVGRFSPEKGALDFAKAASAASLPSVFIGQGDQEQTLRQSFPNATILGWQSPDEVIRRMRQSRALVFPSRWYETQGLVAIEACAVGLPVIYSDVNAASADLTNGETGLAYKTGNVDELANVMKRVATDPAIARNIGTAGYNWYWSDPWTIDRHVDQLEAVYERLFDESASGRHQTYESTAT